MRSEAHRSEVRDDYLDNWTQITPDLWLGGIPRSDLPYEIKYSLSVVGPPTYSRTDLTTVSTHFEDVEWLPPEAYLHSLADLLNSLRAHRPTYVHCKAGINRSALICGIALVKSGYSSIEAIDEMRLRRGPVLNNQTFYRYLLSLK
jgi:hypothetical protein